MSDQSADRHAKLEKIRALGIDAYGGRFPGVASNEAISAAAAGLDLQPGEIRAGAAARFRSAGRVVLHRDIGSLIFITVRDWTGVMQYGLSRKIVEAFSGDLAQPPGSADASPPGAPGAAAGSEPVRPPTDGATMAVLPGMPPFPAGPVAWKLAKLLDLGDIIGVEGQLGRTKTGELTLWVDRLLPLSKALRPPPEKWHGLTDVELRYRRRYVDLFANPDSQRVFIQRARIIAHVRRVLERRGFLEVETPVLQPIYGGAAARPFATHHNTLDMQLYLRISPELYLKRCLVGGLERVYEFARCFRNEGISPRHNPEFTMLELYQAYGDYHDMMEITEEIVAGAAWEVLGTYQAPFDDNPIDYTPPWPRRRYADLMREYVGVDLHDPDAVLARAQASGLLAKLIRAHHAVLHGADPHKVAAPGMEQQPAPEAATVDQALLVNALFEEFVEHHLIQPTFVIDYPAPLCPLTRRHPTDPSLALRFEAYVNGMELGNAYSELNDPAIQRENLAAAVAGEGQETMRIMDEDFIAALEYAMPPAGGLGIGIDRLCMLLTGSTSIRDVLLFPLQRRLDESPGASARADSLP